MSAPSEHRTKPTVMLARRLGASAFLLGAFLIFTAGCADLPPENPVVAKYAPDSPAATQALAQFNQEVKPILENNCYECHSGANINAGIAFDKLTADDQILNNPELWLKVLKNTRAGIMPKDNPRLSAKDQSTLDNWIKFAGFNIDPQNLDPGRVTVHRLNRAEYQNTIHDLVGVDFDTDSAFPGDDIGYGFDNIADVLNVSPLLMEKYLAAAQTIAEQGVPTTPRAVAVTSVLGRDFLDANTGKTPTLDKYTYEGGKVARTAIMASYLDDTKVVHTFPIATEGDYKVVVEQGISSNFHYNSANCTISILVDGKPMTQKVLIWNGANGNSEKQTSFYDTIPVHWAPGDHEVTITAESMGGTLDAAKDNQVYYLLRSVKIEGPADPAHWVHPPNYDRFFTRDVPPASAAGRRAYAREVLRAFATKAYRRPVPDDTLEELVALAEKEYSLPDKTFEMGVAQAMVAVLASPRFLFRIDVPEATSHSASFAKVDEYSLASRLSYFLWSTTPDDELLKLAAAGQLRNNLDAQVRRMVADPRADALVQNFSEQWLQSRAVTTIPINTAAIIQREIPTYRPNTKDDLTPEQRTALDDETVAYFGYVMHNDRSVDEFLDSNYIFLNSILAGYYYYDNPDYAKNFSGPEMRKVDLAPGDWRGGVLTMGSVMMVTSNPTRTSPVKRGKWILDNILDAPAPPPPPNIPALETAANGIQDHTPSQREILALHRADPNCSSCHDRMDPLGLSLENFSALGTVRFSDMSQPIDASGKLSTGEAFKDIRDLKHILVTNHREEFYHCLAQKMLTYALGRGIEYYDIPTVDKIVENMDKNDGHFSSLLMGIIDSAAFQEERTIPNQHFSPASPATSPESPSSPTNTHS